MIYSCFGLSVCVFVCFNLALKKSIRVAIKENYWNYNKPTPLIIIFEAPTMTSEREFHCTAQRAIKFNKMAKQILNGIGVIFFPTHIFEDARMFDSTEVLDGLHASMDVRMEVARIFLDYLCRFNFDKYRQKLENYVANI